MTLWPTTPSRIRLLTGAAVVAVAVIVVSGTSCGGGQTSTESTRTSLVGSTTAISGPITTVASGGIATKATLTYPIVASGQTDCYNNTEKIDAPAPGTDFYGQDAQHEGNQPSYTKAADGLTVTDNVTGLVWQQSPDTNGDGKIALADKMTWEQAQEYPAKLNAEKFGGYDDWRLPSIKQIYSLILFIGLDLDPHASSASGAIPFLDTNYFTFAYGDTAAGERIIDSQYVSSTKYVSTTMGGKPTVFGVNFADGRIKGYALSDVFIGGSKKFTVLCVRGNPDYGTNEFVDNGDGTITDKATGLMWAQSDSGKGLNWQQALAWAQQMNGQNYFGHNDWRVPSVKELQSIIDYARSPDTSQSAAIAPLFECTGITDEAGEPDFPCYWTSTTHMEGTNAGWADYMAFGRAMGYMNPDAKPTGVSSGSASGGSAASGSASGGPPTAAQSATPGASWMDVHGAGAQRSDPKVGDPAKFPYGLGPQGDAIRIYNYVRLVRDAG
jgi:hypothetical protein